MSLECCQSSKVRIKILNPRPGEAAYTSLPAARRYAKHGLANWEAGRLRLVEDHPSVMCMSGGAEVLHHSEGGGMARLEQVQSLPVAGPAIRMFYGQRAAAVMDYPTVVLGLRPSAPFAPSNPPAWPLPRPRPLAT